MKRIRADKPLAFGLQRLDRANWEKPLDFDQTPAATLDYNDYFQTGSAYRLWKAGNPYEFVQTYEIMREAFGYALQYVNFGYWPEDVDTEEAGREMSLLVGNALGLKPGDRLVEGGSGLGQAAIDLCRHFDLARSQGMNPCTPQVRYANDLAAAYGVSDRVSHRVCDASVAIRDYEPGTFTHGMAMECIGVFPDPDAFLRGMHDLLPSGGRMAFTVVTSPRPAPRLQDWSGKLFFGVGTLTGARWAERLEEAGFVDVRRQDITQQVFTPMIKVVRTRLAERPEVLAEIGPLLRWAINLLIDRSDRGVSNGQMGYELLVGVRP